VKVLGKDRLSGGLTFHRNSKTGEVEWLRAGAKAAPFLERSDLKRSFYQDRLGTNRRELMTIERMVL
jgi:hypothetical protein